MNDRKEQDDQEELRPKYEPPRAEDIDTTHSPAEVAAGGTALGGSSSSTLQQGVEQSDRWH